MIATTTVATAIKANRGSVREALSLPCAPSDVGSLHWPFVQRQDSGLWIREWWFESTRANSQRPHDVLPCLRAMADPPARARSVRGGPGRHSRKHYRRANDARR